VKTFLAACLGLWLSGCSGDRRTGEWIDQLRAPDASQRLHAIKALSERQREEDVIVPALTEALRDSDAFVRRDAARALGRLKEGSRPALPTLRALAQDRNAGVRRAAAEAMAQIAPETAGATGPR